MKDWKGNTIKVGDTVKVYLFRYLSTEITPAYLTKDGYVEGETVKTPEKYTWELCKTHKIIGGNRLILSQGSNPSDIVEIPLLCLDFMGVGNKAFHAICIEGVSDNQEDFMQNHFEVNKPETT